MDEVIIALGSNVGDRHRHLRDARKYLRKLSTGTLLASPIYLSEPVGPSSRYFLNAVVKITIDLKPQELLNNLKSFEQHHGRDLDQPRWSARTIDLDIISCSSLVIQSDTLIIPHPKYTDRLFVLKPMHDICPGWRDPLTDDSIEAMLAQAPDLQLKRTSLCW